MMGLRALRSRFALQCRARASGSGSKSSSTTTATASSTSTSTNGAVSHHSKDPTDSGGWEQVVELAQFGCLVAFVNTYVMTNMQCIGPSMLPTLGEGGDNVLMLPTAGGFVRPQRGDVVVVQSPTDPTSTVCKRIGGLSNDLVNYQLLPGMPSRHEGTIVPRGHCFLRGDNDYDSTDSRYYGPVPLGLVRGVVFAKLWPLSEMKFIGREKPPPPPMPPSIAAWLERQMNAEAMRASVRRRAVDVDGADAGRFEAAPVEFAPPTEADVANAWRQKLLREGDEPPAPPEAKPSQPTEAEVNETQAPQPPSESASPSPKASVAKPGEAAEVSTPPEALVDAVVGAVSPEALEVPPPAEAQPPPVAGSPPTPAAAQPLMPPTMTEKPEKPEEPEEPADKFT